MTQNKKKIITLDALKSLKKDHPRKKIVHCHGVFDLFHYGHLLHLNSVKRFGDILVVTLTADKYVNKGPGRPRYTDLQRAMMLASLEVVDYVSINHAPTGVEPIQALKPDFYVKGPDYRDRQKDITGKIGDEEMAVNSVGGRIVFTDDPADSSTQLINQYFSPWDENQKAAIDKVKSVASADDVIKTINTFEKLKVLVVGEPIVDSYAFCTSPSISSKSPNISARFLNQEDYAGGSMAIANHLSSLGCQVTLLITHGNEPYFQDLMRTALSPRIDVQSFPLKNAPTPRKTRFITASRAQRIFELTHLRSDQWKTEDPDEFCESLISMGKSHDMVLAADFGHGLFEGSVLEALKSVKQFLALNVQTNSSNYGYNLFTKHSHYDYLSMDEAECRLALHDRLTPIETLAREKTAKLIKKDFSVTIGTGGSMYFDKKGKEYICPVFFKDVVDTTGAGDAFFTTTALFLKCGVSGALIPFLGNCFAGLKTKIIGNKSAVSKIDFIRTVQSILK